MNNERRKRIQAIVDQLDDIASEIGAIREEEEEAFEGLPESLQQSERGEAMESAMERLESAIEQVEDVKEALLEATA